MKETKNSKITTDAKSKVLAWLQFAIDLEDRGLQFYRECLASTHHARAMELFDYLVKVETGHKKVLQDMLEAYSHGDHERMHHALHDFMRIDIDPPLFEKKDLEKMTSPYTALHDMFNKALKFEKEGLDFYRKMQDEEMDESLKSLFKRLADDEADHYREIKELGSFVFNLHLEDDEA